MEPAFYLIAILGCGEGDAPCEQVRRLEPRYESQAACTKATDAALLAHGDADYPVVIAQCVGAREVSGRILPVEIKLPAATPRRASAPAPKARRS
jgi:hypothetical protein